MTIRLHRGNHADGGTERPVAAPAEQVTGARAGGPGARRLGALGLALVLIAAMDSIRNLPTTATFGWAAIFFYAIAVLTYLIPVGLCSAELATTVGGGMYRWVREAFGSRWGFLAVWCDWSNNIAWFPTVMVFLATTAAYVINPNLSQNKAFLVPVMLVVFWGVTLSSLMGSLKSARWTGIGVLVGTAVPTAVIIALGLWWVGSGNPSQIPFHATAIVPPWHGLASLVYAAGIVVAFSGMELGGFYSHVTRNVKRSYPVAVLVAAATVASLAILGSLAIAMVVPGKQIELAGGIMQAVSVFFTKLGIGSLVRPFGALVIIGVLCGLASWSMGPAEGMRRVAADGHLNPWWGRTNRRGAPTMVLLLQAILGSVVALAMVFVNNINTYYWILTALVAQTVLVMYFLMFISVARLRITKPDAPRPFKIPGGKVGLILVVGAGVAGAVFTFFLGFVPATNLSVGGTVAYVAVMVVGMAVNLATPFLLHRGRSLKADSQADPNLLVSVGHGNLPDESRGAQVHHVVTAARRALSSRLTPWVVAGVALATTLAAILVPGGGDVSPDAASFEGLPQVGALFQGSWQSEPHFCTASVVDSPSGDVIATAAHCLSGDAKDVEFVPMYHDGQAPYGAWDVTGAYVSQRWILNQDPQADFAFLTVRPQDVSGKQRTLQSVVGGDPLVVGSQPPQWTVVVGYPAGTGGQPVICLNQAVARRGYPSFRCGGFVGGTSGGPWLADYDSQTGLGDLYGVTGGRHQGGCVSWVSYTSSFDADTMAVYKQATTGQPPDVVPSAQPVPC